MSLVEALTNVAVGCGIAVLTRILVFPVFGLSQDRSWAPRSRMLELGVPMP